MNKFRTRPTHEPSTIKDIAKLSAILSKALFNQIYGSTAIRNNEQAYDLIADLAIDVFKAIEQEEISIDSEQPEDLSILAILDHARKLLTEKYKINLLILQK